MKTLPEYETEGVVIFREKRYSAAFIIGK